MLGPVSAPTNLYPSVQDNRTQAETRVTDRLQAPPAPEPYSASTATAIAGNLNIMLLSAPERMSQNLVVLTEVLASVLKMKQEPNEPLTTFAARLIEAIATLAPSEQQKLKAMLSDAFAGLQLRTLLQALRNPQGPEAATLAIYLELYRQKDRDPGARAVISSYRQNDELAPNPTAMNPTVRDPRASAQEHQPSVAMHARQPTTSSPIAGEMPVTGGTAALVKSASQAIREEEGRVYGPASAPQPADLGEPTDRANLRMLRQMRDRLAVAGEPPQSRPATAPLSADPSGAVAPRLPEIEPVAAADVDRPHPVAMRPTQDQDTAAHDREHALPTDPRSVAGQSTFQHSPMPLPEHLFEDVAEIELLRTLLALYVAEDEPNAIDMALEALIAESDEAAAKPAPPSTAPLMEGEADDIGVPSLQRPVHWEEQLALATSSPVNEHGDPVRMAVSGDGLPLAFVNYVIESEDEAETLRAMRKDQQEDEQPDEAADEERAPEEGTSENLPEDDAEASAPDMDMTDTEDRLDLGLSAPQLDAGEILQALPSPDEDPAQALYLRLSDLA